jgi:hypothetical protein
MSHQVDYLPVAVEAGSNVDSQANFSGSTYQATGFVAGLAQSKQMNKAWRQPSMLASAVTWFISNMLDIDVLDDGDRPTLTTNFTNAVIAAANSARNNIVGVAYNATPVFDASQGDTFEIVLTGNVTSSTLINVTPGQNIRFIVKQDGTGGHAFPQPTVPATGGVVPMSDMDNVALKTYSQRFLVDSGLSILVDSAMIKQ